MLRIYPVILEVVRRLAPVVAGIARQDPGLAKQMRAALASVPLNTAEGMGNVGGHKRERYQTALGSARETRGCIDTAQALGYIGAVDATTLDMLDHVTATLVNLAIRRRSYT